MSALCPVCGSGRMLLHGDDLVCHNPRCQNVIQKTETHHLHPKEKCNNCKVGRAVLDNGEFVCDNCGMLLPVEESPLYNKIVSANTDVPQKLSKYSKHPLREALDKHTHIIEEMVGKRTIARVVRDEKRQVKTPTVDQDAKRIRREQKIKIDNAICDMTEKLDLKPAKVLSAFESQMKNGGMNLIANKGHMREPDVVAAGFIFKVYRNEVTIRQVKKLAGCGNKSLQKILKLISYSNNTKT
jgi:hypothetical protein